MATQSNSTTNQVTNTGGQFSSSAINARFKDSDYGAKALGDPQQLRKFFAQLNPIVQQVKANGDTGVNIGNLDGDIISYPIGSFQSDWTSVTAAASGVATGGTGILCFDGTSGWVAVRKNGWGDVSVHIRVTTSGAGTIGTLPQEFWPAAALSTFALPAFAAPIRVTISNAGVIQILGGAVAMAESVYCNYPAATISPGTVPGVFPLYLKVAQGRTPVAVVLAGMKPTTTGQDVYKTNTGSLGFPVGLSWTWLSGTAPDPVSSQKTNTVRVDSIPGLVPGINYVATFIILYSLTGQSSGG